MAQRRLIAAIVTLSLFAADAHGSSVLLRGQREASLQVSQVESGGIVRQWTVPTVLDMVLETDFNSIRVVGLFVEEQASVFEDAAHNFEFAFRLSASVKGDWEDINNSGGDVWTTGPVSEEETSVIELDRRIFGNSTHYLGGQLPAVSGGWNQVNFAGYPDNILYDRPVFLVNGFGSVYYDTDRRLSFKLEWPGETSLSVTNGDFDGDGDVDGRDFLKWQREDGSAASLAIWSHDYGTTLPSASTAVPEPNSALLCLVAVGHLLTRSGIRR
jgi:hypothetical protein